jgi:hypothetical protein
MIAVGMVQPSTYEIIEVIAVGHRFVPAGRAMLVRAARLRRALHGIAGIDRECMLVDVILVRVMQMAIMEIIDMAFMADCRMPAVGAVLVGMVGMMLFGAGRHDGGSFLPRSETGLGIYEIGPTERSFRSFPRKRESRAKSWVPAFAGTNGRC